MDNRLLISIRDYHFSLYHNCVNSAPGLIKLPVLYVKHFTKLNEFSGRVGSMVTRLWAERSGGRILAMARDCILLQNFQAGSVVYVASYRMRTGFFPRGKAAGAYV